MPWGIGQAFGILSILGYVVFVYGAALLWFHRENFPIWFHDEFGAIRRKVVRHAIACDCAGLREETRFRFAHVRFLRKLGRIPRRQINRGVILLCLAPLLLLLDFFI